MTKEPFPFEEYEIKALAYLCMGETALFMTEELRKYSDENEARKVLEKRCMDMIDDILNHKREEKRT